MPKARIRRWYVFQTHGIYADVVYCNAVQAEAILKAKNTHANLNKWSIALESASYSKVRELIGY